MREFDIPICINDCDNQYSGSKSEYNLWAAYVGESMAAIKYTYYASVAKKAGYEVLAEIFRKTACNEREHAKIWFKELNQLPKTPADCLTDAITGEIHEWSSMYKEMACIALDEGYENLARLFQNISDIERKHEERYQIALSSLDTGTFFRKTGLTIWECRNCGYRVVSEEAPESCPVCNHPRGYFQEIS